VIIPNHSRIEGVSDAVESACRQRYEGRIEIYLVYLERPGVARLLREVDDRVTAIPTRNLKLGGKRNVALAAATEDLVAFLDDDDIWHPDKLSEQVAALESDRDAVACCTKFAAFNQPLVDWPAARGPGLPRVVTERELMFSSTVAVSSVLIDGDLARALRFTEEDDWFGVEDLELWLRVTERGHFLFLPRTLTGLRIAADSITRQGTRMQHLRALNVIAQRHRWATNQRVSRLSLVRRTIDLAILGGGVDEQSQALLRRTFDGSVSGPRLDPLLIKLVEHGWRSRRVSPFLRRLRHKEYRLRLHMRSSAVMEFADPEARKAHEES
jgi:glycosyltransferase involved in cell wall biosynthesis